MLTLIQKEMECAKVSKSIFKDWSIPGSDYLYMIQVEVSEWIQGELSEWIELEDLKTIKTL